MPDSDDTPLPRHLFRKVPRRTNECCFGDLDGCEQIHVYGHHFLIRLEGSALRIWQLMDGRHTVDQMVRRLAMDYHGAGEGAIREQVAYFLLRLEELGLAAWRHRPLFEEVKLDD